MPGLIPKYLRNFEGWDMDLEIGKIQTVVGIGREGYADGANHRVRAIGVG